MLLLLLLLLLFIGVATYNNQYLGSVSSHGRRWQSKRRNRWRISL